MAVLIGLPTLGDVIIEGVGSVTVMETKIGINVQKWPALLVKA